MQNIETINDRLIRIYQVKSVVGLSKSQIYKMQSEGSFPRSVAISSRAVAWREKEIQNWIRDRRIKPTRMNRSHNE